MLCVCRIETYNQSTKPIVDHYSKLDKVRNIAADGSPDQVSSLHHSSFSSLVQPYRQQAACVCSCVHGLVLPGSPHPAYITSSQSLLSSSITPSVFQSRLKTHCDRSDFPPRVREETSTTCDGEVFCMVL